MMGIYLCSIILYRIIYHAVNYLYYTMFEEKIQMLNIQAFSPLSVLLLNFLCSQYVDNILWLFHVVQILAQEIVVY